MKAQKAYTGCEIFDGQTRRAGHALLVDGEKIADVVAEKSIPAEYKKIALPDGLIAPGFVDLQVNGGGGVMLNDAPDAPAIATICEAHLRFGTTSLMPTLITDEPQKTGAAISAVREAISSGVRGALGLHLEGPHLATARKGAHDAALIRPMTDADLEVLCKAAGELPSLLITVAPETVSRSQIARLHNAGAIISLGHTDAGFETVQAAAGSGATCVTHLFNAMRPLGNREPGVVGAALGLGGLSAGLIADGFHVDPVTIGVALRAKQGPGRIFLVTDAMASIGTELREFHLNGRLIRRDGGRLTLQDGTLAGADLDMISAVRFMVGTVGVEMEEALRMASLYPARVLGREKEIGQLVRGARADFLRLESGLEIADIWRAGEVVAC